MSTTEMNCEQCGAAFTRTRAKKRCDACIQKMSSSEWIRVKSLAKRVVDGDAWNHSDDWIKREKRWRGIKKGLVKINDRKEWKAFLKTRADEIFSNTKMMEWIKERKHCTEPKRNPNAADKRYLDIKNLPSTKDMPYDFE